MSPRTVNPERHLARRLHIIDAALTCFAEHGWDGTTTAAICRSAGIGSGTFFHYFPTKASVMSEVIKTGTAETTRFFTDQEGRVDSLQVVCDLVDRGIDEAHDSRTGGFVLAAIGAFHEPDVRLALVELARPRATGR
jgi:AcrR family transcriptional regulator